MCIAEGLPGAFGLPEFEDAQPDLVGPLGRVVADERAGAIDLPRDLGLAVDAICLIEARREDQPVDFGADVFAGPGEFREHLREDLGDFPIHALREGGILVVFDPAGERWADAHFLADEIHLGVDLAHVVVVVGLAYHCMLWRMSSWALARNSSERRSSAIAFCSRRIFCGSLEYGAKRGEGLGVIGWRARRGSWRTPQRPPLG